VDQNLDLPIEDWSDDQLLDAARQVGPDKPAITEEILRRGLTLPDEPTPRAETVDWSGEGGGEDPGSGALPRSF
jgi:hypothetical protein